MNRVHCDSCGTFDTELSGQVSGSDKRHKSCYLYNYETKFQFMICDRKNRCPEDIHIIVNGHNLTRVTIVKVLGLNIDDQLSFHIHVTGLCKRASKCLIALLQLSGKVGSTKEHPVLLDALLCSIFTYCPTTWHFCSKKIENIMEKICERGLRFVMNDPSRSYEELSMLTKCDTMFLWRLKKVATFMYKCFYRLHLKYFNVMFNVKEMPYSMRDDLKFILPKFNTKTYGYKSLVYARAKL